MKKELTLEDVRKYQNLLAKQFNEIGRLHILSNQETWTLFLEQEESDLIPREHLAVVKSLLLGCPIISLEEFRDLATYVLKEYKYCTIIRVLFKMTDGNLIPELVDHSLKMTAKVLNFEVEAE